MKELLSLLLQNIDMLRTGLCGLATLMRYKGIISEKEEVRIRSYILINKPKGMIWVKYWFWNPGEKEPRIKFINELIQKL